MKKPFLAFLIGLLALLVFAPQQGLFAKTSFHPRSVQKGNNPVFSDEESFVVSSHLPLEEDYKLGDNR